MTPALQSLLVGSLCLLAHGLATLVWLRLPGRLSPVMRHAASAALVHVVGTSFATVWLGSLAYGPNAAIFGFGVIVYLFVYCAVYKSVSLRILCRLLTTAGYGAALAQIMAE